MELDSLPLDDPARIQQDARSRLLRGQRWVVFSVVLTLLVMAKIEWLFPLADRSGVWISAALGITAVLLWVVLWRAGHPWEGGLLVVTLLLAGALSALHLGTVRSASTLGFMAAVVMAGTYLGVRALLITSAAGLALLAALTAAEARGLLPAPDMAVDLRFWVVGSAILAITGLMLVQARHVAEAAYLRRLAQMEERMRLERERDQSMRRARRLFQINPTALVIQAAGSQAVQEVNPAFERLLGHPASALLGQGLDRLWADPAGCEQHTRRLLERGRTGWVPAVWRQADGQTRQLMISSEWLDDSAGALVLTTVMDGAPSA